MRQHAHGLQHFHSRKPKHKRHANKFSKFIYAVVFIDIAMTLPQVLQIWLEKDASGVSAISWGAYTFTSGFWLAYAVIHKIRPMIISAILWIVVQIFIVIGVFIYG